MPYPVEENGLHSSTAVPDGRTMNASLCCRFLAVMEAHSLISTLFIPLALCPFDGYLLVFRQKWQGDGSSCSSRVQRCIIIASLGSIWKFPDRFTGNISWVIFVCRSMQEVSDPHENVRTLQTRIVAAVVRSNWGTLTQLVSDMNQLIRTVIVRVSSKCSWGFIERPRFVEQRIKSSDENKTKHWFQAVWSSSSTNKIVLSIHARYFCRDGRIVCKHRSRQSHLHDKEPWCQIIQNI